jgi:acetylornithine deacetylase/succinyl-diaminopimelate desuccinylase-like protein
LTIDRAKLEVTSTKLLQTLIRFNTVNPPGDEAVAQAFIQAELEEAGFTVELYARDPGRPNLVATLKAPSGADGPTLGLLSHVDTVLADPEEWDVDPWSGEIKDDCIWGRGAQDMKGQTAAEMAAVIELTKSGWRPETGALKVIVTSDEEAGGNYGARWLCETHPEVARCDMTLNEGGGQQFTYEGTRYFRVGCAEKGFARFNIVTHGKAGHASVPRMGENALTKMAPILTQLANNQPDYDLTAEPKAILEAIFSQEVTNDDLPSLLAKIEATDPRLAVLLEPTFGVTLTPTMIEASQKVNVIPGRASTRVDCRVPPGFDRDHAEKRAREVLGEGDYELEFDVAAIGNASAHQSPMMDVIKDWVKAVDPDAIAVPSVLPGFTDSRWFRDSFPDCIAYGFFPQIKMDMYESDPLIHSANERIPIEDLTLATEFFASTVPQLLE